MSDCISISGGYGGAGGSSNCANIKGCGSIYSGILHYAELGGRGGGHDRGAGVNELSEFSEPLNFISDEYHDFELGVNGKLGNNFISAIKKSLGYLDNPLSKCRHCGQWGAAYCECKHCGAPIDP